MKKIENLNRRLSYFVNAVYKAESISYFEYTNDGEKTMTLVEEVRNLYNIAKCEPPSISLATSVARLFDSYVEFYEELSPYDSRIPNPDEIFGDLKISELFGGVDIARNHILKTRPKDKLMRYNAYFSFFFLKEAKPPYEAYLLYRSDV